MNINSKDPNISSFFRMSLPELAEKKAEFITELTKLSEAIDQGSELVHTADGCLITQNPDPSSPSGIADTPSRETLALLHDLFMLRLTIQQLDLATTHNKQLHTIQNFCSKIILGPSHKADKPSPIQASLLQAINFADSGVTALWKTTAKQWGFETAFDDTKTLSKEAEVSKLFKAVRASPQLLKQALVTAAKKGHFEIVRVLSEDKRVDGETCTQALLAAASNGHKDVVMLLAAKNPDSQITYKAICAAAKATHMDIVEMLLSTIPNNNLGGFFALQVDELLDIVMGRASDAELFASLIQDKRFTCNSSNVLEEACGRGCTKAVELLLQHKPPHNGSRAFEYGLYRACIYGHTDVVKVLLQDSRVVPGKGTHLVEAAKAGKSEVVSLLLADPRVLCDRAEIAAAAAENCHMNVVTLLLADNRVDVARTYQAAIVTACGSHVTGHLDVVKALVSHPLANHNALNLALCKAVSKGCSDTVAFLLQDNRVNSRYAEGAPFTEALCNGNPNHDIIKMLLDDRRFNPQRALLTAIVSVAFTERCNYKTLNMVLQHKRTNATDLLAACLNDIERTGHKRFIKAACESDMKVFGLPLSRVIPDKKYAVESLQAYLASPAAYLQKSKVFVKKAWEITTEPIPARVISAVQILHYADRVNQYKRALASAERARNRFTNVDDEARIGAVRNHFHSTVQPHFNALFTSFGPTQEERITAIEYQMRKMFLDEIVQEAKSRGDSDGQAILAFINALTEEEKSRLLQGNDPASMTRARALFYDTTSAAQTAWRAYDRWAAVSGEWPNLLTPPLEHADKTVFTVGAVGFREKPTTQMASDLSREIVAYSFLLAVDKDDGDDDARATRKTAFIAKVAEIRRAHNARSDEQDDPSCLPGTYSRAGDMWIAHSKSIIPDAPKLLEEEFRTLVIELFQKASKSEQQELHQTLLMAGSYNEELRELLKGLLQEATSEEHDLYNALVMLSSYNAEDVIDGKAPFTDEQVQLRNSFINRLGRQDQLKATLNARLAARGSRALSDREFSVYVPALLFDIGGPWIAPQLTAIFRTAVALENPFAYTPPQKGISQQAAIAMLTKLLATIEIESKMRFILDTAKSFASGDTAAAHAKLLQVGVLQESITDALAELEKARAQATEKRQRKAALWDELYRNLKNTPLANKDELLKEIVDEVIDGQQELAAVLKQHIGK